MLLECGLTLPLLILLVMAVIQFAHIWTARHVVAYAAYSAARATLSVNPAEQRLAAELAARRVCAWINLAGLPERIMMSMRDDYHDGEIYVPGWGYVPNSESVGRRIGVYMRETDRLANVSGQSTGVMTVTVTYRFPLVMPVAGSMISWLAKHKVTAASAAEYMVVGGWTGEAEVLDVEKSRLVRRGADGSMKMDYMEQGVFPYIELQETCVLPMPYSTANMPISMWDTLSDIERRLEVL